MDIVGIGVSAADYVISVPNLPGHDEKVLGTAFHHLPGGVLANTVCAASQLGRSVGFISTVGGDSDADVIIDSLSSCGVDTSRVRRKVDFRTFFTFIMIDPSGEKALVIPPLTTYPSSEDVDAEYIWNARLLHAHLFDPEVVCLAARIAKEHNLLVSLDAEVQRLRRCPRPLLDELLVLCDIVFANRASYEYLRQLPGAHPRGLLVATQGRDGCSVITPDGDRVNCPGFAVRVVDTTGAGDAFAAGFIHAHLLGLAVEDCGVYANAVGALATTKVGARGFLPTNQQVQEFISSHATSSGHPR